MACRHLKELYDVCQRHGLKLSSSELIRVSCPQCDEEETCPSVLADEYTSRHHEDDESYPPAVDPGSA